MTINTATSVLRSEHAALRKILEFTKSSAKRVRRGESTKPEALSRVVEFFRVFLEEYLLTKERVRAVRSGRRTSVVERSQVGIVLL